MICKIKIIDSLTNPEILCMGMLYFERVSKISKINSNNTTKSQVQVNSSCKEFIISYYERKMHQLQK